MTELEPRAGEALERTLDRYARVRLEPSAAQAKRARTALMEAAWRQRIRADAAGDEVAAGVASVSAPEAVATGPWVLAAPAPRVAVTRWGARRLGVSMAAAVLAGLLVGSTTFAASRAGGPLYDARLALEELTLPSDSHARLEAELGLAQSRLAEILEAVATDDRRAVTASVRGYLAALDDLSGSTGGPADRALVAIEGHRAILLDVLERVPVDARPGVETALERSALVIQRLDAAGTKPTTGRPASGGTGSSAGVGNGSGSGNAGGNGNGTPGGNGNGTPGGNGNGNAGQGGAQGGKPAGTSQPAPTSVPTPETAPTPATAPTPNPGKAAGSTPAPGPSGDHSEGGKP